MTERFIEMQGQAAIGGMKSAGRVQNIRTYIQQFKHFVRTDRPASSERLKRLTSTATLELVKKHRRLSGEHVFAQPSGELLVYNRLNRDTYKGSDIDLIAGGYKQYVKPADISDADAKSLKCIRATSATKLGQHAEYVRFAQHFLGHAPRSIAEKFMSNLRSSNWMRRLFGLESNIK